MLNQPFHGQLGELLCEKLGQPLENTACFTMFSAFAKWKCQEMCSRETPKI